MCLYCTSIFLPKILCLYCTSIFLPKILMCLYYCTSIFLPKSIDVSLPHLHILTENIDVSLLHLHFLTENIDASLSICLNRLVRPLPQILPSVWPFTFGSSKTVHPPPPLLLCSVLLSCFCAVGIYRKLHAMYTLICTRYPSRLIVLRYARAPTAVRVS